ncbi:MAG: DUF1254 domain-containing protein [Caulobacteraceae bacterium]|nr:MAG: DUF1254 domain-containing protein [Caulobacteraceae bacterium]
MTRRELMLAMSALGLSGLAAPASAQTDLKAAARDAWIFGLPLIEMALTRARQMKQGLPPNFFAGGRALADHTARAVTTPNNDTLYLSAWLDLTEGPVTLTVPETGDRYWSLAVMDMYTNNNAVLGSRTVGGGGGTFTLCGPGQPSGGPNPVRIATPHAWALARVLVDGPEEVAALQPLLRGFKLSGKAGKPPGVYAQRDADPAAYFASARELMASDPATAMDLRLIRRTAALLGEGQIAPADLPAVAAGIAEARGLIMGGFGSQKVIGGWRYPRANLGDYGQDYAYRAAVALGGLGALPPAEALYMRPEGEKDGLFHGDGLYRFSLPADVPLSGFWSLSMYEATPDGQFFFTDNPLKRYAIGDRSKGLRRRRDGGVDVWIGRSDPGGERSANWLPAPKTGPFTVTWRGYLPGPALLNGEWRLSPIVRA